MLVVFEGLDKAGKSTQVALLSGYLQSRGIPARIFKYPQRTETVTGDLIDRYLRGGVELNVTAASLLLAANLYECRAAMGEAEATGQMVIFDRYAASSIAYSMARGLPYEQCDQLTRLMPVPDYTMFLGTDDASVGEVRGSGFGEERFERVEFQAMVAKAFASLPKPAGWIPIDAHQTPDAILSIVKQTLNL